MCDQGLILLGDLGLRSCRIGPEEVVCYLGGAVGSSLGLELLFFPEPYTVCVDNLVAASSAFVLSRGPHSVPFLQNGDWVQML